MEWLKQTVQKYRGQEATDPAPTPPIGTQPTPALLPSSPTTVQHQLPGASSANEATTTAVTTTNEKLNFVEGHHRHFSDSSYTSTETTVYPPQTQVTSGGGHVNPTFVSSTNNIGNTQTNYGVYREQYWTWSCTCNTWTKREKVLLGVIAGMIVLLCGVLAALVVVIDAKNSSDPTTRDNWRISFA